MGFVFIQQIFIEHLCVPGIVLLVNRKTLPSWNLHSAGIIGMCVCIILYYDNFVIHYNVRISINSSKTVPYVKTPYFTTSVVRYFLL